MRICFVYQSDYPWDVRVEKLCQSLLNRGHKVFLVCRNVQYKKEKEVISGINIRRLPRLSSKLLNKIITLPFYLNFYWLYYIYHCVRVNKCDLIIVRDLPLLLIGLVVAKIKDIKIIYDMAECYPNMYKSMLELEDNKIYNFLFKNPYLAALMENIAVHKVDTILVMIEESRDRLLKKGIDKDKILIIKNTPIIDSTISLKRRYEPKLPLKLLYIGFITRLRGIDLTINALYQYYKNRRPNEPIVEFNIVGIGRATKLMKELVNKYALNEYVHLHGWCSQEKVRQFYLESDIGILTYPQCSHWNSTIPNKLFDYMAMGLPVIASDVIPIKRIINETGCGICINPHNYEDFHLCLQKMSEPEYRAEMAKRGIQAIVNKYNWSQDVDKLFDVL